MSNPRRLIWDTGPQRPRELDAPLDQPPADAVADRAIYEAEIQRLAQVFKEYGREYAAWLLANGGAVQQRYVVDLPPDVQPGWKQGGNRVVIP